MRNIPQAATGKRVNASSKLPCHLQLEGGEEENVINVKERKVYINSVMECTQPALLRTCSFVVLPRATNTMWNPVRPATGTKNRPATHITPILREQCQEPSNK